MKVASIDFGQVTWIVDLNLPTGRLYLPEALRKLVERYEFVHHPSIDQMLMDNFIPVFQHGRFGDSVIRKFSMHNDGLIAESAAGTECADDFLDDLIKWMKTEYGMAILNINDDFRIYDSNLLVQLNIDIQSKISSLEFISNIINNNLKSYGINNENYLPSGFYLSTDAGESGKRPSARFVLERRIGKPFKSNLYVSSAPLKTRDHEQLLEQMECFL